MTQFIQAAILPNQPSSITVFQGRFSRHLPNMYCVCVCVRDFQFRVAGLCYIEKLFFMFLFCISFLSLKFIECLATW